MSESKPQFDNELDAVDALLMNMGRAKGILHIAVLAATRTTEVESDQMGEALECATEHLKSVEVAFEYLEALREARLARELAG